MQLRSFFGDFPILSMVLMISSMSLSASSGRLLASFRLARDQTPSSGLSSGRRTENARSRDVGVLEAVSGVAPPMGGGIITAAQ